MRKLTAATLAVTIALGLLLAHGASVQAPAQAAVPIVQTQLVIYGDEGYRNEIARRPVPTSASTGYGEYWVLNAYDNVRISSVLLWNPTDISRFNSLWVHNNQMVWWGKCISRHDWGISWFGPDFNDSTWEIWVGYDPKCPRWTA